MTTITMTFRQLSQSVCYRRQIYGGWTCVRYFIGAKRCCKSNCPIWKRAERRWLKQWRKDFAERHPAKSELVGRSGTLLTRNGKIVRMEKKRGCATKKPNLCKTYYSLMCHGCPSRTCTNQ